MTSTNYGPKDDRDLPAKKKAFEINILNFFLERASVSNYFMALQIKIIQVTSRHFFNLWVTLENFSRWHPIPLGNFYLLAPHLLGIFIDHPSGRGGGMDIFWNHTLA